MDDMVSRKAVIDAVHTATYGFICGAEDGDEMTEADKLVLSINKAVCTAIKALPSVQSEEVARDIATIIENEKDMRVILKNAQQMWIPVTEALPEKPFGCLVTVMDTEPMTMEEFENILPYFVGYDGEQWNDWEGHQCPLEVLAWMPLPEPYKESEE